MTAAGDGGLELKALSKRYGDVVALDDLSFAVAPGQMGFGGVIARITGDGSKFDLFDAPPTRRGTSSPVPTATSGTRRRTAM